MASNQKQEKSAAVKLTDEKFKEFIQDQLGCDLEEISDEVPMADLGADDLDMVELLMAVEDEVADGREIPDETDVSDPETTYGQFRDRINAALASF